MRRDAARWGAAYRRLRVDRAAPPRDRRGVRADRPQRDRRSTAGRRPGDGRWSPSAPRGSRGLSSPGGPSTRAPRAPRSRRSRSGSSSAAGSARIRCRPYRGPPVPWLVAACTASDGTHWAVQSWQRMLPNYGVAPTPERAARELRLSHWSGPLPVLEIWTDWSYRRFHHLYGRLTFRGEGVFGFRSTRFGVPLDAYGRNVFVDTFGSAYGTGWKRENSFLTHAPGGAFCYGFYPHGPHGVGSGTRYRATVIGPGVTPDVMWQGSAPGDLRRRAGRAGEHGAAVASLRRSTLRRELSRSRAPVPRPVQARAARGRARARRSW